MLLILELNPSQRLVHLYDKYNMSECELVEDACRAIFSIDRQSDVLLFLKDIELMATEDSRDPSVYIYDAKELIDFTKHVTSKIPPQDKWRFFKNLDEKTAILYKGKFPIDQNPPF